MSWWAAALLLPSFLLRALIPVGFMPMVGPDHSVQLVVCDSYAPVPWATESKSMDMSTCPSIPPQTVPEAARRFIKTTVAAPTDQVRHWVACPRSPFWRLLYRPPASSPLPPHKSPILKSLPAPNPLAVLPLKT
jgi:hypothetical protein